MKIVSIRGATTVLKNTKSSILDATKELIESIENANNIDKSQVISMFFTCTLDLDKAYPAEAARGIGYTEAGLMCFNEMFVEESLKKCIRIMILCNSKIDQKHAKHIYLRDAKVLRPDLENKA